MNPRLPSSSPKFLWSAIVFAYLACVVAGTVDPWPVAAARLAGIGAGPYVPVTYRSVSSDTRRYRSQIYIVASQVGRSWSTYRVSEENKVTQIEVRGGLLLVAACAMALVIENRRRTTIVFPALRGGQAEKVRNRGLSPFYYHFTKHVLGQIDSYRYDAHGLPLSWF